jgi:hypothetical protein
MNMVCRRKSRLSGELTCRDHAPVADGLQEKSSFYYHQKMYQIMALKLLWRFPLCRKGRGLPGKTVDLHPSFDYFELL